MFFLKKSCNFRNLKKRQQKDNKHLLDCDYVQMDRHNNVNHTDVCRRNGGRTTRRDGEFSSTITICWGECIPTIKEAPASAIYLRGEHTDTCRSNGGRRKLHKREFGYSFATCWGECQPVAAAATEAAKRKHSGSGDDDGAAAPPKRSPTTTATTAIVHPGDDVTTEDPVPYKVAGTLDGLLKVVYESLEEEIGDCPMYTWWGNFLIDGSSTISDIQAMLGLRCRVVENFNDGLQLVNYVDTGPLIINEGPCPAAHSVTKHHPPPHGDKWYYIGRKADRMKIMEVADALRKISKRVYLVVGLEPMTLLHIPLPSLHV